MATLLERAVDGDADAFSELVAAHRAELRAHCYRMLGSVHDADDALQEALLRAWKNLSGFSGRGSLRSWLYSIATNTALDIAGRRSKRELPMDMGPSAPAGTTLDGRTDLPWLEPYPDRWLCGSAESSPETRYEQRESVELAFIVAMQNLPPLQRAVLLLREVVGFSAAEIATQLNTSMASVTSALQRARVTVQSRLPDLNQRTELRQLGDQHARELVARYTDAMQRADIDALVSLVTEDIAWSMPPVSTWFSGLELVRDFLLRYPLTEVWRHHEVAANGQLATAAYLYDQDTGMFVPGAVDVLTVRGGKIAAVTGFLSADLIRDPRDWVTGAELFSRFGLPPHPPSDQPGDLRGRQNR